MATVVTEKYKRYGFDTNSRVSNATIQQVRTLEENGVGVMETSRRLGIHPSTVRKYRMTKGRASIPPISEEKQSEIKRLREAGLSTIAIMKETGCSKPTVLKYGGHAKKYDWAIMAQRIAELEAQGIIRRRKQAAILGVHYNTLLQHFGPDNWSDITVPEVMRIRTSRRRGISVKQLAREYGVSQSTIYSVINSEGRFKFI